MQMIRICFFSYFQLHIRISIYSVFLRDYLKVFPKEQVFIQRLEDREDLNQSMREVFTFLEMGMYLYRDQK